jgi:hypothetical protein
VAWVLAELRLSSSFQAGLQDLVQAARTTAVVPVPSRSKQILQCEDTFRLTEATRFPYKRPAL